MSTTHTKSSAAEKSISSEASADHSNGRLPAGQSKPAKPSVRGLPAIDREEALAHAMAAVEAALDKKALEPRLLEVGELCSYAEFIFVVSGRSDRQVDAIGEAVAVELKSRGLVPIGIEGMGSGQWVLVDFGEIVIHVFHHPLRQHYDLESLWNEAKEIAIDVPDEARVQGDEYY